VSATVERARLSAEHVLSGDDRKDEEHDHREAYTEGQSSERAARVRTD